MALFKNMTLHAFVVTAVTAGIVLGTVATAQAAPLNTTPHNASPHIPSNNWQYLTGSTVAADGCEAWMNWTTDDQGNGFYTQGVLESWGNNCEMHYARTGPVPLDDFRNQDGAGTLATAGYWDGAGYATAVCVWEIGQYQDHQCSGAF